MSQTIIAPQARRQHATFPFAAGLFALWVDLQERRAKRSVVRHLRNFDQHLAKDIGLDQGALWQLRPEIRLLEQSFRVAAGCGDQRS